MKLYFSPGACSLAPHIVLEEIGTPYEAEKVNLKDKTMTTGNFLEVNPRGQVPTLKMNNGEILTEGAVIMQYIADQKPESGLMPKPGTTDRYRAQEWLNYVASEIHKSYGMLWAAEGLVTDAKVREDFKNNVKAMIYKKCDWLEKQLTGKEYLMGKTFTAPDAYLFTCLNWSGMVGMDLSKWNNITTWQKRVSSRPAVMKAMKAEGLIKE